MKTFKLRPSEKVVPDDYPIYPGYYYIVDNVVTEATTAPTAGYWKEHFGVKEIRRLDLFYRQQEGARVGDRIE